MEPFDAVTSVVAALSVAFLAIAAALDKKQMEWKRRKPLPVRDHLRRAPRKKW